MILSVHRNFFEITTFPNNYTLCLNTYGYSLLIYKVYHEEGECRQLEFWLEKEQILEGYSAQLQKS